MSETTLIDLQQDLASRLKADEYFADVPVFHERKKDISSEVERSVGALSGRGGKTGVCAIVMSPVASVSRPELRGALMEIELTVRILENVIVNLGVMGTQKAALSIARRAARVLHLYKPDGLAQCLIADSPTIVPVEDPLVPLAYEVRFKTSEADTTAHLKVATPAILPRSGTTPLEVTLSTTTSSAEIWYTFDGTHPYPDSPNALRYNGAIDVQTACNLRACAFLSGYIASDTSLGIYT